MATPREHPDDLPPPTVVQDEQAFESMLEDISGQSIIAFDTEADSFFNYREKVCLIQVTVEDRDYVLDPLAGFDISALGRVFKDPESRLVFHDGEYDILILKRDFDFEFAGLFDTRVAAAAIGETSPGLASVLKKHFGVELDKTLQRSNWSQRPLDPKQISYARLDTRYLIPLMETFERELEKLDRMDIVCGEFRRLEALESVERVFNPDEFARLKGVRSLDPLERQALRELYIVRDRLAEKLNRPPFKIMSNQVLFSAAHELPSSLEALERVPMFSSRMVRKMGRDVLEAIERAQKLGPLDRLPRLPSKDGTVGLDDEQYELHERLRTWRKRRSESECLDSSLIMNRHVLLRLASERPRDRDQLSAVDGFLEWQAKRFGEELLRVVDEFEADLSAGRGPTAKSKRGRRDSGAG